MGGIGDDFTSKGISHINNINGISGPAKADKTEAKMGTFGYGFQSSEGGFVRSVVPQFLSDKFNFEAPKYEKNIAQLTISDRDYIPDRPFEEENAFCEV